MATKKSNTAVLVAPLADVFSVHPIDQSDGIWALLMATMAALRNDEHYEVSEGMQVADRLLTRSLDDLQQLRECIEKMDVRKARGSPNETPKRKSVP